MILMVVIIVVVFIYALTINSKVYYYGFSLIIGGALGNLFDRYQYAAVLDFIDVHYNNSVSYTHLTLPTKRIV